mmetsp:Transcript_14597/g.37796  ORF Transcript_14597/g.37796 Transcript_14597/m.37796 type:complete len:82 (-) Transcript_14597:293-538(-)
MRLEHMHVRRHAVIFTPCGLPRPARRPFAVINLLRRAQLEHVVKEGLKRGIVVNKEINEHNSAALEAEGFERLRSCFERWT